MNADINIIPNDWKEDTSIIKVIGVGGGGCNAVNYMYKQNIQGCSFIVCNTDAQALQSSEVPVKIQMGQGGLGAGTDPTAGRNAALESQDEIARKVMDCGTRMLFITAGMGGGTGTGASAVVAEVAQEMGILTVGIVTIPFAFEGKIKIRKAMTGVARLAEHVDALLVINNEKLKQIYPDLDFLNAFSKSDDVVCNAAKSIAEIITIPGYINTDFADVYNTLKNGNMAIMNVGQARGENRISAAIENALNSPLINTNDVHGAKRVLLQFYFSSEHAIKMQEINQINQFIDEVGSEVEVQWGTTIDDSLGEDVRVTIIATGYEVSDIPTLEEVVGKKSIDDAIIDNYSSKDEPEPKEDEKPAEIDLTQSLITETPAEEEETEQPAARRNDMEEIEINFDDEPQPDAPKEEPVEEAKPQQSESRFKAWMRNRRS